MRRDEEERRGGKARRRREEEVAKEKEHERNDKMKGRKGNQKASDQETSELQRNHARLVGQ